MIHFRQGSEADIHAILALFDANIAWLAERGLGAQWGSEPWSGDEKKVEFVRDLLSSGDEVVGASLLTDHPMPYVPPAGEPERYLKLLIASPQHRGMKIGHQLIQRAREETLNEGANFSPDARGR